METELISLSLSNGFEVGVTVTTPDAVETQLESHVCYYGETSGEVTRCVFSVDFQSIPSPEPAQASVSLGVLALCLLAQKRRRV